MKAPDGIKGVFKGEKSMSKLNNVIYVYEKEMEEEIKVPSGVIYSEKPTIFGRRTKQIRIVFKDKKNKRK